MLNQIKFQKRVGLLKTHIHVINEDAVSEGFTQLGNSSVTEKSEHLLVPKCSFCDKEMDIAEGDVIYDSKWYHQSCWIILEDNHQHPTNNG